jgi:hypothetical protein
MRNEGRGMKMRNDEIAEDFRGRGKDFRGSSDMKTKPGGLLVLSGAAV